MRDGKIETEYLNNNLSAHVSSKFSFFEDKDKEDDNDLNLDIVKKEKKPHTPEEQLKIVLPQQEDSYYYPKKTPLHSFMKRYYWECHPIMPNHS